MKWLYRHLYRKEKGFTLVELMIVIIILAILTGIAVPSYMVLRTRARVVAAKAELKNLATALAMYNADYEAYPATLALLVTPAAAAPGETAIEQYIAQIPTADPWGTEGGGAGIGYLYDPGATLDTYDLTCLGADGAAGVDDWVITDGQPQW